MFELTSEEMKQYFKSLPLYVQETLHQTDAQVKTLEDLKKLVENLQAGGNTRS